MSGLDEVMMDKPLSEVSVGQFLAMIDPKINESITFSVKEAIDPLKVQVDDNSDKVRALTEENLKLQKTVEAQARMIEDQKRQNNLIILYMV